VRRQAEAQVAEVRAAAARENDDLRASADAQIAELKRILDDIRTTAEQQIDTARRTLETEVAAVRARAKAEVEDVQRAMNERLGAVTRDLNATRVQLDAARTDAEAAWRDLENAHKEAHAVRLSVARHTDRERLPDDLRSLDAATSLSDVLDRLTQAAARHAERAALLIAGNGRLRRWQLIGLSGGTTDGSVDASEEAGIAADALRDRRAARRAAGERGPVPAFAPDAGSRDQAALPVTVAGSVVAVLYADAPVGAVARQGWQDDLDLLARYSSRVLETITVQQASGIRPVPPGTRNPEPGTGTGTGAGQPVPGGMS
jgi:hypothetical protein